MFYFNMKKTKKKVYKHSHDSTSFALAFIGVSVREWTYL